MKIVNILTVFVLSMMIFLSCDKSEQPVSGKEGGLIEVKSPSVNYVVGNSGPYTAAFRVYQGDVKTTKIEIFKTFNSSRYDTLIERIDTLTVDLLSDSTIYDTSLIKVLLKSNTVFFKAMDIAAAQNTVESYTFNFDELKADLVVENEEFPIIETDNEYVIKQGSSNVLVGQALPASDGDYLIGDYWEFEYNATTSDGNVAIQNTTTKATVATRYAGKYRFVEGVYYRIGVLTNTGSYWPAETLFESIDAKTYKMNGVAAWPENVVYFQIDAEGKITYPAEWGGVAQTINGNPLISCETSASDMTEVCGLPNANTVIKDDVAGKDQLIMSYGYYTAGSGPRVFYQVMEKIVE